MTSAFNWVMGTAGHRILLCLSKHKGIIKSKSKLAMKMKITMGCMLKQVGLLESFGLVETKRVGKHKREKQVGLTFKGRQVVDTIIELQYLLNGVKR